MNKPKLVLVGSMTLDVDKFDDQVKERYGGGVFYGGVTAATLKIPTRIITLGAGDIEPGLENLRKLGIEAIRVKRDVSNNFSNDYRTGNRKLYVRSFFTSPFSTEDFEQKIDCDALILFPGLNEISGNTISEFNAKSILLDIAGLTRKIGEKNAEGLHPILQGYWESISEFRNKVDILKVSHEDLENIEFPKDVDNEEKKAQNLAENGFPIVLFTKGERPTILARNGLPLIEIPTYKLEGGDVAGAGEVFSVGFMTQYCLTGNAVESVAFGNACASFKILSENYNYEKAKQRAEEILKSI